MKISDIIEMSMLNLWRRRVRTFLTVLGVIIGTTSIVVMVSIGVGVQQSLMKMEESFGGLKEIMVYPEGDMESKLLSDDTVEKLKEIETVERVDPQLWFSMPIQIGRYETYVSVVGVSDETLGKIPLSEGELPKAGKELEFVMGSEMISELCDTVTGDYPFMVYEDEELEGEEQSSTPDLKITTTPVIAGLEKQVVESTSDSETTDASEPKGDPTFAVTAGDDSSDQDEEDSDFDDSVDDDFSFSDFSGYDEPDSYSAFTPDMKRVPVRVSGIAGTEGDWSEYSYECYARLDDLKEFIKNNYSANEIVPDQPQDRSGKPYRDLKYTNLTVTVDQVENVDETMELIQEMGYRAETNKEWLEQTQTTSRLIEAVLGGIGAVAMLVAAISIANTMTMSIYERTKEIGVMKVLGCSLTSIRSMFLSEAAMIGFLGGVVGVASSYGISLLLNNVLPNIASNILDVPEGTQLSVIPIWLVVFAIVFSTFIGMFAGFFPAQRATRLSPLAAIRND